MSVDEENVAVQFGQAIGLVLGRCLRLQAALQNQPSSLAIFAYGATKRSLFVADGFAAACDSHNIVCAGAILRLQLDTALRVHATSLVADPEAFVIAVMTGTRVDKMFDRSHRKKLTDSYLAESVAVEFPWVEQLYIQASGFVHFSEKHLLAGASPASASSGQLVAFDFRNLHDAPASLYVEVRDAFMRSIELTNLYVDRLLKDAGIRW